MNNIPVYKTKQQAFCPDFLQILRNKWVKSDPIDDCPKWGNQQN